MLGVPPRSVWSWACVHIHSALRLVPSQSPSCPSDAWLGLVCSLPSPPLSLPFPSSSSLPGKEGKNKGRERGKERRPSSLLSFSLPFPSFLPPFIAVYITYTGCTYLKYMARWIFKYIYSHIITTRVKIHKTFITQKVLCASSEPIFPPTRNLSPNFYHCRLVRPVLRVHVNIILHDMLQFTLPPAVYERSICSSFSAVLGIVGLFHFNHCDRCVVVSHWVLIPVSLMTKSHSTVADGSSLSLILIDTWYRWSSNFSHSDGWIAMSRWGFNFYVSDV